MEGGKVRQGFIELAVLTAQVLALEKKIDKLLDTIEDLSRNFNDRIVEITVLKKEFDELKKLDLSLVKQRVDDVLGCNVFEGVKGGLLFNKLVYGVLVFIAINVGALLLVLYRMFGK